MASNRKPKAGIPARQTTAMLRPMFQTSPADKPEKVFCLPEGTLIRTTHGDTPIQDLHEHDLIVTDLHGLQPLNDIEWLNPNEARRAGYIHRIDDERRYIKLVFDIPVAPLIRDPSDMAAPASSTDAGLGTGNTLSGPRKTSKHITQGTLQQHTDKDNSEG